MTILHRPRLQVEQLEDRCVPATFTVTKLDDAVGAPGLNLREAVAKANLTPAADTIVFKTGLKGTITLSGADIDITESLTINGPGAGRITVSGDNASRIFDVDDGDLDPANLINVTIRKLSLTRGAASGDSGGAILNDENLTVIKARLFRNQANSPSFAAGGAIHTDTGSLNVTSCTFFDNLASHGGAIFNQASATISSSTFSENRATAHGGAVNSGGISTELIGCTFTGNSTLTSSVSGSGGAIYHDTGSLILRFCTVSGNASAGASGGIEIEDTAEIHNSTIAHNTANGEGGGIRVAHGGDLLLSNSTVSGNWAIGNGGGIAFASSGDTLTVHNSTIAFNDSRGNGGGIFSEKDLSLFSTIVARNQAVLTGDDQYSASNFFTVQNCLIGNSFGTAFIALSGNQFDVNPLLGPLASNGGPTQTHALLPDSPAINNGSNPLGLLTDQRGPGYKRVKGGFADIGAFEF